MDTRSRDEQYAYNLPAVYDEQTAELKRETQKLTALHAEIRETQ